MYVQESQDAIGVYARFGASFLLAGKTSDDFPLYNTYNPAISVELMERYDRVVGNHDTVEDIQLVLTVHQHRIPVGMKVC